MLRQCTRCPRPDAQRGNKGFTVVDLLAVIFTLILLLVVLLPATGAVGDSARRALCLNNLQRLGAAQTMYPAENRDYMALPNWDSGQTTVAGWLYTSISNSLPDPGPGGPYESSPVVAYSTGSWFQYVGDPKAYLCPADIQSRTYAATNTAHRAERLSSYIMNGSVCGFSTSPRSYKITDVWNSGCWLLWGPDENAVGFGNPGIFAFNDGSVFPNVSEGLIEQLHTVSGGEILTVGGGVQFVSTQRFKREQALSVKNLAWWNPGTTSGH